MQHALTLTEQGKTPVYIGVDGKMSALFGIADRPRATAGKAVAMQVGIDAVIVHAKPERKLEIIRELRAQGNKVGMIRRFLGAEFRENNAPSSAFSIGMPTS